MFEGLNAITRARIQFAFTVSFHIVFPSFTIGLASWLAVLEWRWLKTGNAIFAEVYRLWVKIFAMPSMVAGPKRPGWPPHRYAFAAMPQQPKSSDLSFSPSRRRLIATATIVAAGSVVWSQLPKGSYPTDLSRIGQGQAALVLAIDSNYSGGASVMELLNDVRHDFADSVQFLVASLPLPNGQITTNQFDSLNRVTNMVNQPPPSSNATRRNGVRCRWPSGSGGSRA